MLISPRLVDGSWRCGASFMHSRNSPSRRNLPRGGSSGNALASASHPRRGQGSRGDRSPRIRSGRADHRTAGGDGCPAGQRDHRPGIHFAASRRGACLRSRCPHGDGARRGGVAATGSSRRQRVLLVFQPAEERGGGSRTVLRSGVLEGVRAIFGGHVTHHDQTGEIMIAHGTITAQSDRFRIASPTARVVTVPGPTKRSMPSSSPEFSLPPCRRSCHVNPIPCIRPW